MPNTSALQQENLHSEITGSKTAINSRVDGLIRKHPLWRVLEIIPGSIAWLALAMPLILSFYSPELVASFVIIYTLVWLFRSVKLSVNLYRSYRHSREALKTDWSKMIGFNDYPEKIDYELRRMSEEEDPKKYFELLHLGNQIKTLKQSNEWKKSKDIHHAIIFVTYKESYQVIRESVRSYAKSRYPSSKLILVLAGEEADRENFLVTAKKIEDEFGAHFGEVIVTLHPSNLPGEIRGKSANATWGAKQLKKFVDRKKIPYDNIIISNFDADTVAHPQYFSELTFKYLTTPKRTEKAYQPTHLFHNNIWDVPVMIRMVAQSCSFWRMA
ncbi:MAG TPA: hypothetical protein VI588_04950, partial [Candidatus Gracilibacteria bacterium]|nr:hypothetical protein [Candidatus Gracilibacteria bacterium]